MTPFSRSSPMKRPCISRAGSLLPIGATWRALAFGLLGMMALAPAVSAGPRTPQWLTEAIALPATSFDRSVPAVVLHQEERMTLDEKGRVQIFYRYAVRILLYEGREHAAVRWPYRTDGGSVRSLDAWLISPQGSVTTYGKGEVLDVAAGSGAYSEARARVLDVSNDADVGSVFGCEIAGQLLPLLGQFEWSFQSTLPALRSVFSIEVPPAWRVNAITLNHAPLDPVVRGGSYTWELRNLPPIDDEPARPPTYSLVPRLAVTVLGTPRVSELASFESWSQVAKWLDDLSAPSAQSNSAIAAKAQALAAAAESPYDRVRAIGLYAQELNYVSIQMGISRGGGYRPHPAADVFAKSYGDCKDKANLMKTMLQSLGVESYLLVLNASDPSYVRRDWPTPSQFDHCIVAIRLRSDSSTASVEHPVLGPLLLFDPTDPETPFGSLPEDEQGSWGLLVSKDAGALLEIPVAPPERNRLERRIEAELDPSGGLSAAIHEWSCGQRATRERRLFHTSSGAEYRRAVEEWVGLGTTDATVSTVAPRDNERRGEFELDVGYRAGHYAQPAGNGLMVYKPALVSRLEWLSLTAPKRKYPVVLEGRTFRETTTTKLPAGFEVEDLPKPISLTAPFGSYTASIQADGGELRYTRSMHLEAVTVPVEEYETVRSFFEKVRNAEQAPVVLSRR